GGIPSRQTPAAFREHLPDYRCSAAWSRWRSPARRRAFRTGGRLGSRLLAAAGRRRRDLTPRPQRDLANPREIDLGHVEAQRAEDAIGQFVVSTEVAAEPAPPGGDPAVGVQLERG